MRPALEPQALFDPTKCSIATREKPPSKLPLGPRSTPWPFYHSYDMSRPPKNNSASLRQSLLVHKTNDRLRFSAPKTLERLSTVAPDPRWIAIGSPFARSRISSNRMLLGSLATTDLTCRHNHFDFKSVWLTTPPKLKKTIIAGHTSFRVPRPRFQLIATCAVLLRISLQLQMFAAVWPGDMRVAFE